MSKLLIKLFVKDYKNTSSKKVRSSYGNLASIFGIISNIFVCIFKLLVGILFGLISLIADGLNNLTDAASSIIALIGFKLSSKPADKDHPFGHARIEYISGFIVSIIICILGIQLIYNSVNDVISNWGKEYTPMAPLEFYITIGVLGVAILAKAYQGLFYNKISKIINSSTLKATALDSRNDVIATSAVLIGLIFSNIFKFYIDGYLGCAVGLFILYSGYKLIIETSDPLISEKMDPELIKQYIQKILSYDGILGIHDVQIHSYGPSTFFASLHAEVDSSIDILITHDLIDNIEKEVQKEFNILTTIHMDPVVLNDPYTEEVKNNVIPVLKTLDDIENIHDFRVVKGPTHTNIVFDVIIKQESKLSDSGLKLIIEEAIHNINESYCAVITIDHDYVSYVDKWFIFN